MSSQLNVDTIVDKAGSGGTNVKIGNTSTNVSDGGAVTQNTVQGLLKAWVHAHQHDRQDSFNIASQTDTSTGDYTFTYTNNFSNVSHCPASSNQGSRNARGIYVGNLATSTFRVNLANSSGSVTDYDTSTVIAGDLA
jgi:hypothetical protein